VPIPQGQSLEEISSGLLNDIEREASEKRDRDGKTILERFEAEENPRMLPLPTTPFEVRRVEPVTVSSKVLGEGRGAYYSVPSEWARLSATAYLGVKDVAIVCRGARIAHERQRFGEKRITYPAVWGLPFPAPTSSRGCLISLRYVDSRPRGPEAAYTR
jgi:hypothetical protein